MPNVNDWWYCKVSVNFYFLATVCAPVNWMCIILLWVECVLLLPSFVCSIQYTFLFVCSIQYLCAVLITEFRNQSKFHLYEILFFPPEMCSVSCLLYMVTWLIMLQVAMYKCYVQWLRRVRSHLSVQCYNLTVNKWDGSLEFWWQATPYHWLDAIQNLFQCIPWRL